MNYLTKPLVIVIFDKELYMSISCDRGACLVMTLPRSSLKIGVTIIDVFNEIMLYIESFFAAFVCRALM